MDPARLVFLDESGAQTSMTRTRGRAPRGQRVVAKVPGGHWKVVTMISAVRTSGPFAAASIVGATDSDVFRTYVREILTPQLRPGDVVVMDNLTPHKASGVREAIEAAGAALRYLPPYSPDLQSDREPVEQGEGQAAITRGPRHRHASRRDRRRPNDRHAGRLRRLLPTLRVYRYFGGRAALVHIRRNPYDVFQSSLHTIRKVTPWGALQRPRLDDEERAIRQYREVYDAFFEERGRIPSGRLHELTFEALERDPLGELRKVYAALALPEFERAEPAVREYVNSISGYAKNAYAELSPDVRERIAHEWRRCFDEWGYPV